MKKKTKKIYELGGSLNNTQGQQTGAAIGNIAGQSLNLLVPGLGAIAAPLLGQLGSQIGAKQDMTKALQDHFNSLSNSTNPYGNYQNGGKIDGGYDNLLSFQGDKHSALSGGITVGNDGVPTENGNSQVEDGETALRLGNDTFIFSKHLKI